MIEKIKVLLVEDNPGDARLIKEDLSPLRFELKVTGSLNEALTHLDQSETDIVLSDLSLPDSEFTHTIAALHAHVPDVAIIVLTGLNDKRLAVQALQLGAQDFIVKGHVDPSVLEQRIVYAIERKKTEESQAQQRLEIVKQVVVGAKLDIQKSDPRNIFFRCVEDCSEGIMILDKLKRVIYVNPAWEMIYGYASSEIAGKTLHFLLDDEEIEKIFTRQIDEGNESTLTPSIKYWRGEVIQSTKAGKQIPVLLTIAPSFSALGILVGFTGISLDMTAQRDLENHIIRQENLVSIGILASGLAHEIGTPLGIIRGHAELLLPDATPTVSEGLEVIISQIDRISTLVSSLLNLGRSTKSPILSSVNLHQLSQEVLSLMAGSFQKQGISLTFDVPNDLNVIANPNQLQQVLINVLINGVQAIEEAIKKGRQKSHKISLTAKKSAEWVNIFAEDTGIGVPTHIQKKIFQPFFTTKDIGKGTGLGLAIVFNLIQEMGGSINIESEYDKPTLVTIKLKSAKLA
jgi:two-component system cell cycle sensor histidine kinase/response regulator CckA